MKTKVWQEIKNLTEAELQLKLRESEEKLFRLKFKHATTPMKNGLEIRTLRRMIARLKTLMKEQANGTK
jgi:large subunit ribosomal protein L29